MPGLVFQIVAGIEVFHPLYQVAVDFRCTADGYRALYLEGQGFGK